MVSKRTGDRIECKTIHTDPGSKWTIEALGRVAGMSRAAFASRFKQQVGQSVMDYVTDWRMRTALYRLQQQQANVSGLAESLGYGSEAAFRRAFKRVLGFNIGEARSQPVLA